MGAEVLVSLPARRTGVQVLGEPAVGVVVAVNGEIVWADMFASTRLLEKYWPKLIRSYATEAVITRTKGATVSRKAAQADRIRRQPDVRGGPRR